MKAQILKISGHKNEKDFYKEFPTMESFMAKHGAKLRKAQFGDVNKNNIPDYLEGQGAAVNQQPQPYVGPAWKKAPMGDIEPPDFTGLSQPKTAAELEAEQAAEINKGMEITGQDPQGLAPIKESIMNPKSFDKGKAIQTGIGMVDKVIGGFKALKAEKEALKSARTWKDVSGVVRKASETEDVNKREDIADTAKRTRQALMPSVNAESLFPTYGVGTNVLAKSGKGLPTGGLKRSEDYGSKSKPYASVPKGDFAGGGRSYPIPTIQDAGDALRLASLHNRPDVKAKVYAKYPELRRAQDGEVMNTFAPEDIYSDLGYEPMQESEPGFQPLSDSEIIKAYKSGGLIPKAFWGSMLSSGVGQGMASGAAGGAGGGMFSGMGGKFMQTLGGGGGGGNTGAWQAGGDAASSLAGGITGNNAGSQIGGGFGEAAGSLFGPIGGAIGKTAGTLIGGLVDRNPQRTKKAQEEMMRNVNVMSGMSNIKAFGKVNSGVMEHGGYTNPRMIKYFAGHDVDDLFVQDPMMNTLRSGGNLRSNQIGDIRVDNRGRLEPISYNPYTAGTGFTSMIQGPSHDRGGVNVDYNGNMVEAEGGEPIIERQEGGNVGDTAAVITGDQTFNKVGAHEIPELSQYLGKKVKHIHKEIAEDDAKWNKRQAKNDVFLKEFNPVTQIDKLTFNSLTMNEKGINDHYQRNALKTQQLIAYQDAINEEAESRGLDAGALSRGQVKPLPPEEMMYNQGTAQGGKNIYKDMEEGLGKRTTWWGGEEEPEPKAKPKAKVAAKAKKATVKSSPTPSDIADFFAKAKPKDKPVTPRGQSPLLDLWNDFADAVTPYTPEAKPAATATKKAATTPVKANTSNTVAAANAKVNASPTGGSPGATASVPKTRTATPAAASTKELPVVPNTMDLPGVSDAEYAEAQRLYDIAKKTKKGKEVGDFQRYFHSIAPDYARAILKSAPLTKKGKDLGVSQEALESNVDDIFGPRTEQYMASLKKAEPVKPGTPTTSPTTTVAPSGEGVFETAPYKKYGWENLAGQLMPWLRKTPGEPLLGDQLAGEMYSMMQHEEPVQARFAHPQLDVPYDISYQDRLNENQATFNSLQRAAGTGNPEAMAMLAGQKYGADSNVLAEQFRANQAKKDQVYSQNRQTLNEAQRFNLGLADQQYVRQSQAKSNTKAAMQESLNSIASKIGQNRLENRTLQTYANMFPDFSYGKDYNIRKTGAPTTFNMPVIYNAAGDITHVALYDSDGKIYDYRPLNAEEQKTMGKKKTEATTTAQPPASTTGIAPPGTQPAGVLPAAVTATTEEKKAARNGGLVRAFKNL